MATKTPQKSKSQLCLDEVQKVLDHYQFAFKTILQVTETGISPVLMLIDVPPKEPIKKGKNGR